MIDHVMCGLDSMAEMLIYCLISVNLVVLYRLIAGTHRSLLGGFGSGTTGPPFGGETLADCTMRS